MKIKEGFIKRTVGGSDVVVAVGEASVAFNAMISLNGSASLLWSLLENGATEEQLLAAILEKYDVDEATAKRDISAFLDKMRSSGCLDE